MNIWKFINRAKASIQAGFTYIGSVNPSSKIKKNGTVSKQHTYSVYLAPAKESGYNTCSHSTPECRLGCLATSGLTAVEIFAGKNKIQTARIKKTKLFYEQPEFFMQWLIAEISAKQILARKKGFGFSVRLNATSDIDWANVKINDKNIFEIFPDTQFYDYTKNHNKFFNKPRNYHLTYSYTGRNWHFCESLLMAGHNVAMVFNAKNATELPTEVNGYKVINGDLTDYRVKDGNGVIVGLTWKRIADRQKEQQVLNSCFVVNVHVPMYSQIVTKECAMS